MDFNINDVTEVKEVTSAKVATEMIQKGWHLLAAGVSETYTKLPKANSETKPNKKCVFHYSLGIVGLELGTKVSITLVGDKDYEKR